jgi:hypothetical protein
VVEAEVANSEWRMVNGVRPMPRLRAIRYALFAIGIRNASVKSDAGGLSGRLWAASRPVRRSGARGWPTPGSAVCCGRARAPGCLPKPAAAAPARPAVAAARDRPGPARSSLAVGFETAWPETEHQTAYRTVKAPFHRSIRPRGPRVCRVCVGAAQSPSKSIRALTPVSAGYAVNALVVAALAGARAQRAGAHQARPYEAKARRGLPAGHTSRVSIS